MTGVCTHIPHVPFAHQKCHDDSSKIYYKSQFVTIKAYKYTV